MESILWSATTLVAEAGEEHHNVGWGMFAYLGIILVVLFALILVARTGLQGKVFKKPLTQFAEHGYLFIEHLCVSVIGPHGKRYVPFIATLWLLVFFSNMLGLVLPHTPSADWSLTLGLALVVFCYVQYEGVRVNGPWGHVKHFAGPKLDLLYAILMTPLIFGIEIISELIKILSLSVRLYGNITAGHTAKATLDGMAPKFPILGALIFPLEFLVAIIQAFVFALLACIYLSLVTSHEAEHSEAHDDHETHSTTMEHAAA